MTLADLNVHVQLLNNLCNQKQIRSDEVELYFADTVLFDIPSGVVLVAKRPISSLHFKGDQKQLLLFDPTSWEQNRKANKM